MRELPLLDFVSKVSPHLRPPYHLQELVGLLERSPRGGLRWMCSVPIRHWKTITIEHWIAWCLAKDPTLRFIFMTHSAMYASERGREIREICERAGLSIKKGHSTIHSWRTEQGGGVYAMSAQQSGLGQDVDVLIVDDPFEGPESADDEKIRHRVDETIAFYTSRLSRGGTVGIVMSRFHLDDVIGRRVARKAERWHYVHHRALVDEGQPTEHAFAPEIRSLAELKQIRAEMSEVDPTQRMWWSQWQNAPRTDSGDLFHRPHLYDHIPDLGAFRYAIGVDLAYSVGKRRDWFAVVSIKVFKGACYVLNVERFKADPMDAIERLKRARDKLGKFTPIYSYMSGPEIGMARYVEDTARLAIQVMPARYDKRTRAQKTIDAHNAGRILYPSHGLEQFFERMASFRGVDGDPDDEIDALVSACDGGMFSALTVPKSFGKPRM